MVFVTSLLKHEAPGGKVALLINDLHDLGYHVKSDRADETYYVPNNLSEIMYDNLNRAEKVIIVLPELDIGKMNSLIHGLGNEYRYIISGIYEKQNKYILLSFTNKYLGSEIVGVNLKEPSPDRYQKLLKCLIH